MAKGCIAFRQSPEIFKIQIPEKVYELPKTEMHSSRIVLNVDKSRYYRLNECLI